MELWKVEAAGAQTFYASQAAAKGAKLGKPEPVVVPTTKKELIEFLNANCFRLPATK